MKINDMYIQPKLKTFFMIAYLNLVSMPVLAFDMLEWAKTSLILCYHPTADVTDMAGVIAFFIDDPQQSDSIETARIKVAYKGWFFTNELTATMSYDNATKKVKLSNVFDSNISNIKQCKYEYGWELP